ncbi:sine oculis-binding protein homolog [Vanessa cardui]|uniref:sine oculis-binding protein homolog n=1 Tax=Vanessa cardui TaxID=171605 RepID=UPI001F135F00|nr:sine oculis-binding protein homolog [Vanessa cardui]
MDKNTTNPPSPSKTKVKKENEEEIKEFAETAMNELLGWYGYERLELRRWAASRARDTGSPEQTEQKNKAEECSWCNKNITSDSGALQQAGAAFCSELCFSQSRRANFKRAKTCDWCRHVRHTVAYVDFQDGATQLQFCSDKCLNQYKMHIFCRETQAHLDLNPHLVNASSSSNLITPELWLKNCKSRSVSPASERSGSPTTEKKINEKDLSSNQRKSPLPLITIAPPAKLMNKPPEERCIQKSPEGKKDSRTKMNLRKRRTSKCSATVTSQTLRQQNSTPKAQDMRMCSPSIDGSSPASSVTVSNSAIHSPPNTMNQQIPPPFPNPMFGMPPPVFVDNNNGHINEHRHPMFVPRLGFIPPPPGMMHQERPRLFPPMNFPQPIGQAPPVTVLVPYPVILPIPLPIPIPIPLSTFIQAHRSSKVKTEVNTDDVEGPLDFTMNGDKKKNENVCRIDNDVELNTEAPDKTSECDPNKEINERIDSDKSSNETADVSNPEQTLPKFKITRLGNKMAKIVTKTREPSESSRPLRKRRRLVEATDDDSLIPKTRKIVQV